MKRKWLTCVGIGLACTMILGACGNAAQESKEEAKTAGGDDKVTIKFVNWGGEGTTGKAFEKMIETYEEKAGIEIESQTIPYNQVLDQLLIMTSGDDTPDCAQIHGSMMSALVASGALEPLDDLITEEAKADFYENVLEPLIYDNKMMGIPWVPSPDVLYYNKELLEKAGYQEPPKTAEEMYDMAKAIGQLPADEAGNKVYGLGVSSKKLPGTGYQYLPYLWAEGGNIVDDEGNVTMDTPEMKAALSKTGEMMQDGVIPLGLEINDLRSLFAAGQIGFLFEGDYGPTMFAEASSEGEAFLEKVGAEIAPVGVDGTCMSAFYEHDLGVFSGSKHKEEATAFIEWLSGPEAMQIYCEYSEVKTPGRKSVRDLELYKPENNADIQLFLDSLDVVRAFPQKNPGFQKGMEELSEAIQRVGINNEDVNVVTADLQEKVSKLYEN